MLAQGNDRRYYVCLDGEEVGAGSCYPNRSAATHAAESVCGRAGGVYHVYEVRTVATVKVAGPHPVKTEEAP